VIAGFETVAAAMDEDELLTRLRSGLSSYRAPLSIFYLALLALAIIIYLQSEKIKWPLAILLLITVMEVYRLVRHARSGNSN
jgi:hypothetical protein